jgi:hypothetical protein
MNVTDNCGGRVLINLLQMETARKGKSCTRGFGPVFYTGEYGTILFI